MAQTPLIENRHDGGFLVTEARGHRSRDIATLSGGVKILAGEVLGFKSGGTASATAKAGNTGNGAITMDATTPVLAGAQLGVYTAICTTAATNGGTFQVKDPLHNVLGNATVGSAFSNQIKFTIADGATDFAVGDEFDIEVTAVDGVFEPLDFGASDGTQNAAGISFAIVDVTLADRPGTVVVRDAEVNASELIWPTGATAAQIATATAALKELGVISR
ncbi:head decoration protein [Paraburkholderia caballeronis]|uniref:Bacteriophage lambda head decoration protein D n=1 Tax=Paraburkholderia caballeronis TaxID=416943 RepID=A0A1H7TZ86_9BURK|nr:head decoration protein [Paraburkholderia caballeronis]PXW23403.1 bacteriophage lambda head decoration protein D [Paraburkholderia caballeronis]PXW98396.1 bacteriophage lambda head decoration protein D [Paraburkholderia caballeronis]RAJ95127.1 bacteriophage lambda head decoration protein D [Paraburkholderia caballeronis]SEC55594.1 Bacteriophage lambda head decoration protein D [Paraburkholderia caballeronis]SEL89844.1 Bacteriophage lambda head decoration protein D [Paraburkholderia caballer